MGALGARASVAAGVVVVAISPPLGFEAHWALVAGAGLLIVGRWSRLARGLHLGLAFVLAAWCLWGLFEGWLGVALAVEMLMVRALFSGARWEQGARASLVSLVLLVMLGGTLAVDQQLARPATLSTGPLLSVQGGGSIAVDPGDGEAVQLVLPPSLSFVPEAEEAKAIGADSALDVAGLGEHFEAQLRAAAPEPSVELASPVNARRWARLARARVERDGVAGERLRFISGAAEAGSTWRFECPGQSLGPGEKPPMRRPDPTGDRALCPGKYASPLVAALGAHPALASTPPEPGRRPFTALGPMQAQLAGGVTALLALLLAGLEVRRGGVRLSFGEGLITVLATASCLGGLGLTVHLGWRNAGDPQALAAAWWYLAPQLELAWWEHGLQLARIWLLLAALRHCLGVARGAAPVEHARTSQGVSEQPGAR